MPRAEGEQSMRDNNIEKSKIGNHNNSSGRDIGDHQGVYKPRSERGSKMIAGEGFDHSIPVEFGSNPGFDAFRAPNPDPKGYYAKGTFNFLNAIGALIYIVGGQASSCWATFCCCTSSCRGY